MTYQKKFRCSGPVSRRSFLEVGSLAFTGIGLSDLFRLRSLQSLASTQPAFSQNSDTSVIFVWLPGGFPHMETYDMKPEASTDFRGDFRPIRTNVPGIEVCEHLPLHAKVADRFTLIRSISHEFSDHGGAHKRMLTGRLPKDPTGTLNDAPAGGSIVAKCREQLNRGVPNYTAEVDSGRAGVDTFAFGAAYLGPTFTPFIVPGNPSDPTFSVPSLSLEKSMESRLEDRKTLLGGLDRVRREMDRTGVMEARDEFHQKAIDLLTSDTAKKAFDLSLEDPAVRNRYGQHAFGQRALLARRLVEAGTSFATVVMEHPGGPMLSNGTYNWDCHAVNCHIFDDLRWKLPSYDQAISALIEDLYTRGLDKKVMLVVTGDFGHTPRIEKSKGTHTGIIQPGRDHWPQSMSVLVCGGGMRTGQIVGSTNSKGEHPHDRPLTPCDRWATLYHHLGIDPEMTFPDLTGRPMPILPFGSPIQELL